MKPGQQVALTNSAGAVVATLDIGDVFAWDKPRYIKSVYLTERTDHPGADMVLKGDADKTHLLGGKIHVLPQPKHPQLGKYILPPREVRKLLAGKGWNRVVAFQTRNPLHRAHEYALVYGLGNIAPRRPQRRRRAQSADRRDQGRRRSGDRAHAHLRSLIDERGLGEGDSDAALWGPRGESVPDRVILLGLDIKMFYGGPKEAIMHGIYRQNFGFTDIVIGRKHADAPYADGTAIWGDFDAQEIFGKLKGDLKIQPVKVGFAAYYDSVGRVDLMDNHKDEKPVFISGKDVRKTLLEGKQVDPRIMRPSTSRILAAAMAASNRRRSDSESSGDAARLRFRASVPLVLLHPNHCVTSHVARPRPTRLSASAISSAWPRLPAASPPPACNFTAPAARGGICKRPG